VTYAKADRPCIALLEGVHLFSKEEEDMGVITTSRQVMVACILVSLQSFVKEEWA
jgi:hypothetical protein